MSDMSAEDRLKALASIGDNMAETLQLVSEDSVIAAYLKEHSISLLSDSKRYREEWDNMIGDLQRGNHIDSPGGPAASTDFMEEFGGSYGGTE